MDPKTARMTSALLLGLCAACSPVAPSGNEHLAVVDYWPEQQLLFLGIPRTGVVDVLRVPSPPRQGTLDFVERLTEPARHEVLRIAVDRKKGRLWVADRQTIYVYQYRPRGTSEQIPFGSGQEAAISDLVIDQEGNGYVFVAGGARIYRIDSDTLHSEKWLETTYASAQGFALPATRVLLTKDSQNVLFQSPKDGALLRLELRSRRTAKIRRDNPIMLDCAMLLWNDNFGDDAFDSAVAEPLKNSLTAFHCRGRWIGQLDFDPKGTVSKERFLASRP
jgi:hypothetical protein